MKKLVYLLLIMVLTVICIPANAKSNFYADQNLKLNKEYDSTVFAAGNNVEAKGKVNGISFIAGNDVTVKNERDYLFIGGNKVTVENVETKDAFIAGSIVEIKNSKIRDLYVAADTIDISSEISGKAHLGGSTVVINSAIKGDVTISAETIKLGENANIEGTLKYPEEANFDKDKNAKVGKEKTYKVKTESTATTAKNMFINFLTKFLSMVLIGLVLLALNSKMFKKIEKLDKTAPFIIKTSLIGFGILILVPFAVIILIASTIGLSLGIISLLLYGILIYLSAIPTSYYIGNWILKDKVDNNYLLLIITLLVIYVLKLIPIIGGIVSFVSLCFGLGMYVKLIKDNVSSK